MADCENCRYQVGKTDNLIQLILGATSGVLSIIGSSLIIFIILRRKGLNGLRNRFLFVMSIIDILNSTALGLGIIPSPPTDVWDRPTHGFGNEQTCTAQGFFMQVGTSVPSYNAMLCLYYLAIIKYAMDESEMARKYEWFMHGYAMLPPLVSAIIAATMKLFNTGGRNCWLIHDNPNMSKARHLVREIFMYMTTGLSLLNGIVIIISMSMIYHTVRTRENAVSQYSFPSSRGTHRSLKNTFQQALLFVAGFCLTYIWTFITIIMSATGTLDKMDESFAVVTYLQAFFLPAQGFWNFLAFIRPSYSNIKRNHPELGFFDIIKKAILQLPTRNRSSMGGRHLHVRAALAAVPPLPPSPQSQHPIPNDTLRNTLPQLCARYSCPELDRNNSEGEGHLLEVLNMDLETALSSGQDELHRSPINHVSCLTDEEQQSEREGAHVKLKKHKKQMNIASTLVTFETLEEIEVTNNARRSSLYVAGSPRKKEKMRRNSTIY